MSGELGGGAWSCKVLVLDSSGQGFDFLELDLGGGGEGGNLQLECGNVPLQRGKVNYQHDLYFGQGEFQLIVAVV